MFLHYITENGDSYYAKNVKIIHTSETKTDTKGFTIVEEKEKTIIKSSAVIINEIVLNK